LSQFAQESSRFLVQSRLQAQGGQCLHQHTYQETDRNVSQNVVFLLMPDGVDAPMRSQSLRIVRLIVSLSPAVKRSIVGFSLQVSTRTTDNTEVRRSNRFDQRPVGDSPPVFPFCVRRRNIVTNGSRSLARQKTKAPFTHDQGFRLF